MRLKIKKINKLEGNKKKISLRVKLKRKINLTKEKNGDQIEKNNIL
jgi:hypothetical protein